MSSDPSRSACVAPESIDELAEALRDTEADDARISIRGGGSKQGWGAAGRETSAVIDTTHLARVVEHAPGDLVLTVEAGARLADVQSAVGEHGQRLAVDPPEPGATIGGVIATAASGPLRLRYGPPRDQLIGITVLLADGTVAKSGGKVVKNVAGYDLGKLFTGSLGTLGVIASVTVKLQPVAPARRVVSVGAEDPGAVWSALVRTPATPAAAEWDGTHVHVLVEGAPAAADTMAAQIATAIATTTTDDALPDDFGARPWRAGEMAVKVTHRLSALDEVVAAIRRELPGARLSAHVGSGVVWAGWPAPDPAAAAGAVAALRAGSTSYGGSVVVVDAPIEIKRAVDVWGPVAATDLMHRVKDQFDPGHRLNPGRFVDGI